KAFVLESGGVQVEQLQFKIGEGAVGATHVRRPDDDGFGARLFQTFSPDAAAFPQTDEGHGFSVDSYVHGWFHRVTVWKGPVLVAHPLPGRVGGMATSGDEVAHYAPLTSPSRSSWPAIADTGCGRCRRRCRGGR